MACRALDEMVRLAQVDVVLEEAPSGTEHVRPPEQCS
jgi:hypothetical protein